MISESEILKASVVARDEFAANLAEMIIKETGDKLDVDGIVDSILALGDGRRYAHSRKSLSYEKINQRVAEWVVDQTAKDARMIAASRNASKLGKNEMRRLTEENFEGVSKALSTKISTHFSIAVKISEAIDWQISEYVRERYCVSRLAKMARSKSLSEETVVNLYDDDLTERFEAKLRSDKEQGIERSCTKIYYFKCEPGKHNCKEFYAMINSLQEEDEEDEEEEGEDADDADEGEDKN